MTDFRKRHRKSLLFLKLGTVFVVPLILALPYPPPPFNEHDSKIDLYNGSPASQEKFPFLTREKALGATLLSTILSIDTQPMPRHVCLTNTSEIRDAEGKLINRSDLLEDKEAGSITMPLFNEETIEPITIPFASTTCVSPDTISGSAAFGNEVKVRGFSRYGQPELQVVNEQQVIALKEYPGLRTIFNLKGKSGYDWRWDVYLNNYLLFLIGWIILLSSILSVYEWSRRYTVCDER